MSNEVELKIAERLVDDILAAGHTITVNDGEEDTVIKSSSKADIMAALRTTDWDYLKIDGIGWIWLIWGNDCDVISDYSGPDELMHGLMQRAHDIAEKYSA
jgi:hypothetical protein